MNKTPFVATPADAKLVMDPMSEIQLRVGEKEITNMTTESGKTQTQAPSFLVRTRRAQLLPDSGVALVLL